MQAAAREGGDLLLGMCALVEAWLADVVLEGPRGRAAARSAAGHLNLVKASRLEQ